MLVLVTGVKRRRWRSRKCAHSSRAPFVRTRRVLAISIFFRFFCHLSCVMPSTPLFSWFMFYFASATFFHHFDGARAWYAALVGPINLISTYQNFVLYFICVETTGPLTAWEIPKMFIVCFGVSNSAQAMFCAAVPMCSPQVIINKQLL